MKKNFKNKVFLNRSLLTIFNIIFVFLQEILKNFYVCKKKDVFLQCVTMYIHSSLSREFTLFVKGFINFGFWFWRPTTLNGRSLFFILFVGIQ